MRFILYILLITINLVPAYGQDRTKKEIIEETVVAFFDGLATFNIEKIKSYCTDDIIILEDGLVWNIDTLAALLQAKKELSDFKRVNKFDFFKTEFQNKTAYTCYYNQANVTANGKEFEVRWLESAVLIRDRGRWKIKMLHSTTLSRD